ncbi:MAG TPA: cytochrome c peroxidase [Saprospiraceae bacterium]|nr:cytochrome c peroxidase [Saprospiraceae bacterium]HMQ85599.1 cytochrome c peroxidase [Saprospiraceae bacterium]
MSRFCGAFLGIGFVACCLAGAIEPVLYPQLMEIPAGFPAIAPPSDNAFLLERWLLGKKLFFDPVMSSDSSISCASCHRPELAFSDNQAISPGVAQRPGNRNVPSLANVAYHPYFTREGGVPTLEMQVLVPIQEHHEFDFNIILLAQRLVNDSMYVAMAQKAYQRAPDPFVITRALACFERSLLSGNSPYDQFTFQGKKKALSAAQKRGMKLFYSKKTNCSTCHSGFNFTNYAFENNGLYTSYRDEGRFRLTRNPADSALFKIPSLRNVAITAPYMHDGSLHSLRAVIEHYESGGKSHPQKSSAIQPLELTEREKNDLLAFLESLTDESFIQNPLFTN